jgi:hypothetical protein
MASAMLKARDVLTDRNKRPTTLANAHAEDITVELPTTAPITRIGQCRLIRERCPQIGIANATAGWVK